MLYGSKSFRISPSWQSRILIWRHDSPLLQDFLKLHTNFELFGSCVRVCVCVCSHCSSGEVRVGVWVQDLWWSTLLNDYLFDCVLWHQSVSNGFFWFISRDTAVTCAIITPEYCVLNGPEVQIKYWVSRKKLSSAFKNKDGEWWPCGRGPVSNKGIWSNLGALRYQTCPLGAGKHSPGPIGNLLLAWKPRTHWAILWWLQPQQGCVFKQTYHTRIHQSQTYIFPSRNWF